MLVRPAIVRAERPALLLLVSLAALLATLLAAALVVAWPHDAAPRLLPVGNISALRPDLPLLVHVPPIPGAALPEIVIHDPANPAVVYGRRPKPFAQKSPVALYLVRTAPTDVVALLQVDLFSTCRIPWQAAENRFIDPCYGAAYTRTGDWVRGPARTGLLRFPTGVAADGTITLDVRGAFTAPGP